MNALGDPHLRRIKTELSKPTFLSVHINEYKQRTLKGQRLIAKNDQLLTQKSLLPVYS